MHFHIHIPISVRLLFPGAFSVVVLNIHRIQVFRRLALFPKTIVNRNENIERNVCATTGKVSYKRKNVCATSGKVSYEEVEWCTKSNKFVNISPSEKASCSKIEKASCTKAEKASFHERKWDGMLSTIVPSKSKIRPSMVVDTS